ncbi:MAG: pyridoxal 5'-phosphate synthase lyase subunit PdxS, partial [Trichococcus flocculiformis]
DYALLAELSKGLGEPMKGIDISTLHASERMQERGW